ncbi:hypothetical protein Trydic_g18023 [Trypoxylus dichotomus]
MKCHQESDVIKKVTLNSSKDPHSLYHLRDVEISNHHLLSSVVTSVTSISNPDDPTHAPSRPALVFKALTTGNMFAPLKRLTRMGNVKNGE